MKLQLNKLKKSYQPAYHTVQCCYIKVDIAFESLNEILKCDHSNESYKAVLPVTSAVYYSV